MEPMRIYILWCLCHLPNADDGYEEDDGLVCGGKGVGSEGEGGIDSGAME